MVVTIAGSNYSQISSFDTDTTGGSWDGQTPNEDLDSYKEGSGSMSFVMKTNGTNTTTFTATSPIDLSGTKHLRFWMLSTHGGDFTQLEIGLYDGTTTTGYWVVATAALYPGGWYSCMIDVSSAVDSGTKPTNMNSIEDFIFRVTLTGGKNATNFWLDNLIYCDGLIAYGDDGGSEFDFEDIYSTGISEGSGIISKFGGVYYLTGSLTIGDSAGTAVVDFIAKSQTVIFEDKSAYLSATLYAINVVGNATGATQRFELGEASGTAGINGCLIKCNVNSMAFEFTATDTDVDDFGLYGSTFDTYGTVDLQPDGANLEVIGCNFNNGQGQFQPNTMDVTFSNFISGPSTGNGSVLIESSSFSIQNCAFISNTNAIEISAVFDPSFVAMSFTGNTNDIYNSSGSSMTVSNDTNSNASSYNAAGDLVNFQSTVNVTVHCEDVDGTDLPDIQIYIQKVTPTVYNSHATNNTVGDATFETSSGVAADIPPAGWIIVNAVDEREDHMYRYVSKTTTVFTFPTKRTGSADSGDATTLTHVGGNFQTNGIEEGDAVYNTTDLCWAQVTDVFSEDVLYLTRLKGGTNNTFEAADGYTIESLVQTYDASDTMTAMLLLEPTDVSGDVSLSYNYPGSEQAIIIRARDNVGPYVPYSTTGNIDSGGFSLTIIMQEDTITT